MKYHPHGSAVFVTFSIEQGLLLLSNPLCEAIIQSCLAQAQTLYPTKVCHAVVEATHVHLLAVVNGPDNFTQFMRHFKAESAHRLNRLLGRKKRTIWCEGYDSPVVLTKARAMIAIAYLYSNPSKDDLVESIEEYPGFSTWRMFQKEEFTRRWKVLTRRAFSSLAPDSHNLRGYTKVAETLLSESKKIQEFKLEPNAWMESLGIRDPLQQEQINKLIVGRIRIKEKRAQRIRDFKGKKVMGRERLMKERLNTTYIPERSGKKMWCLTEDRTLRAEFINFLKNLIAKARAIQKRWRVGDYTQPYPLGLYPPSMPKLAEPLSME